MPAAAQEENQRIPRGSFGIYLLLLIIIITTIIMPDICIHLYKYHTCVQTIWDTQHEKKTLETSMKQVSFNVYVFFPLKERILSLNPMNGVLFVLFDCFVLFLCRF